MGREPKPTANTPMYYVLGRKKGARKSQALCPPTGSFSEAASKMWKAFDDEGYDRAEVIVIQGGKERPKFTVNKKPAD
jgi:hypothetical protein